VSWPKLYGIANSRAFRSIWAAEEVGLDYEHVPVTHGEDSKEQTYLDVNPNGRIPALVDGDLQLFESMAINMYLAKKYAPSLLPADARGEAQVWQWSVWGISEIEPLQMAMVVQQFFTPEEKRDQRTFDRAVRGLLRPLQVLDTHLQTHTWLLGEDFTLADLNLAGVMELLNMLQHDVSEFSEVRRWLDACYARPSYAAAKRVGA
jgi:glutathione S-transferase